MIERDLMEEADKRLLTIIAKDAIREKLTAYCRAMDRADADIGRTVFTEDALLDYGKEGMYAGSGWGFLDWANHIHAKYYSGTQHSISNTYIRVDGDSAVSETYLDGVLRFFPDGDGVVREQENRGRYLDRWVCRNGEWFIIERHMVMDFSEIRTVENPRPGEATSRRDSADISYTLF